jgi:hypothetical protein
MIFIRTHDNLYPNPGADFTGYEVVYFINSYDKKYECSEFCPRKVECKKEGLSLEVCLEKHKTEILLFEL